MVPVHVETNSRYDARGRGINGEDVGSGDDESDDAMLMPTEGDISRSGSNSDQRYEDGGYGYGAPTFRTTPNSSSHA
jgi:hypothetical protein